MYNISQENDPSDPDLRPRPVLLLLLDGWGIAPPTDANLIAAAKTPVFDKLVKNYPIATLDPRELSLLDRYFVLGTGQHIIDEKFIPEATLSQVVSDKGWKQIKITESERLAALANAFNGRQDGKLPSEDMKILSSEAINRPEQPRLMVLRLTREIIKAIDSEEYRLIIASIPVIDSAALTGDSAAILAAIEAVDKNIKKIVSGALEKKGMVVISSAGGNAEQSKDTRTEIPDRSLTANPVPLIIISDELKGKTIGLIDPLNSDLSLLEPAGTLADLSPTVLKLMGLPQPSGMTGRSLI